MHFVRDTVEPMASYWKQTQTQTGDSVFRRPLGNTELKFYWDTVFNGVAISIQHIELEPEATYAKDLFSKENLEKSWIRMKQRFPLLGASVEELPDSDAVEFVVHERSLMLIRPEEVKYVTFTNSQDAKQLLDHLLNDTPTLSNELLAQVWVGPQLDAQNRHHIFIPVAHHIIDGTGNSTLTKEFCQEISLLSTEERVNGIPLSERLCALLPLEALNANTGFSIARQRWRSAIAKVIYNIKMARLKGGHTLPLSSEPDPLRPVHSRTHIITLPTSVSQQILKSCRSLGITFGNALPVLSQLAHTRMLHKCRNNISPTLPHISDEEWEHRSVEPMIFAGPLNLRPYLNRSWFENGGFGDICVAISFFFFKLPSMPSPKQELITPDTGHRQTLAEWFSGPRDPNAYIADIEDVGDMELLNMEEGHRILSFSSLLSLERFLLRALMIRAQSKQLLQHPLLHELHAARMPNYIQYARQIGLAWRAKQTGSSLNQSEFANVPKGRNFVASNGGSSLGNRDAILPYEYPIQTTSGSNPARLPVRLRITDYIIHLRCRPSELYLGALTMRGQLQFFSYSDTNTYDPLIVEGWMEEVCNAAIHYLGESSTTKARL